jgi:hypothetical protein
MDDHLGSLAVIFGRAQPCFQWARVGNHNVQMGTHRQKGGIGKVKGVVKRNDLS